MTPDELAANAPRITTGTCHCDECTQLRKQLTGWGTCVQS